MRFSYVKPSTDSSIDDGHWYYPRDDITIGGLLDKEVRSLLVSEVGETDAKAWEGVGVA